MTSVDPHEPDPRLVEARLLHSYNALAPIPSNTFTVHRWLLGLGCLGSLTVALISPGLSTELPRVNSADLHCTVGFCPISFALFELSPHFSFQSVFTQNINTQTLNITDAACLGLLDDCSRPSDTLSFNPCIKNPRICADGYFAVCKCLPSTESTSMASGRDQGWPQSCPNPAVYSSNLKSWL